MLPTSHVKRGEDHKLNASHGPVSVPLRVGYECVGFRFRKYATVPWQCDMTPNMREQRMQGYLSHGFEVERAPVSPTRWTGTPAADLRREPKPEPVRPLSPSVQEGEMERLLDDALLHLDRGVDMGNAVRFTENAVASVRACIRSALECVRSRAALSSTDAVRGEHAVSAEVEHEIELCARVLYRRQLRGAWADALPNDRLYYRMLAGEEREAVYREVAQEAANLPTLDAEPIPTAAVPSPSLDLSAQGPLGPTSEPVSAETPVVMKYDGVDVRVRGVEPVDPTRQ